MDERRLAKACEGKNRSSGGLNRREMIELLVNEGYDVDERVHSTDDIRDMVCELLGILPPVRQSQPVRRLSPFRRLPASGSPVRRLPVSGSPVRRLPVRGSPARGSPFRRLPVRSSPVRSLPARGIPLGRLPVRRPPVNPLQSFKDGVEKYINRLIDEPDSMPEDTIRDDLTITQPAIKFIQKFVTDLFSVIANRAIELSSDIYVKKIDIAYAFREALTGDTMPLSSDLAVRAESYAIRRLNEDADDEYGDHDYYELTIRPESMKAFYDVNEVRMQIQEKMFMTGLVEGVIFYIINMYSVDLPDNVEITPRELKYLMSQDESFKIFFD